MRRTAATAALAAFLASSFAGCASSETGLRGDAGDDGADPSWDPPVENLGEPGWRDSPEPWCPGITPHRMAYSLWSRPDAVFVNVVDNEGDGAIAAVNHIFVNRGTGWTVFYEEDIDSPGPYMFGNIRGTSGDLLFAWYGGSPLATITSVGVAWSDFNPSSVFVVNDSLAWACTAVGLLKWDGENWRREIAGECEGKIWADEHALFATAADGLVLELGDGEWIVHDTGMWTGVGPIWGFSATDVWTTTGRVLLHYDGETWETVDWPIMAVGELHGIRDMWGSDGVLFLNTGYQILRYENGAFETIGVWPQTEGEPEISVHQIWGNGTRELFLAVQDYTYFLPGCGDYYLLWWDGAEFHWF